MESPVQQPAAEESLPRIENATLIIPFNSPERYHYWKISGDRLTIWQILTELNAPPEVRANYERDYSK
ncbi:MAG: hypothetical protein JST84_05035 [Acidobacteria bacterium]|nr:hypothetical protein [Acidobacteriota bacterium]